MRCFFPRQTLESLAQKRRLRKRNFKALRRNFGFKIAAAVSLVRHSARPTLRVFYCRPFKGKPGVSRGRKASGL
jgi:hypothetical protein